MLTHGTYTFFDSELKTPRISLNMKSAKIWPRENKALYSNTFDVCIPTDT